MTKSSTRGVADIVFLIDATGSMADCIVALKENIGRFIEMLTTKDANNSCPVTDWRGRVIGYRDFKDNPKDWFISNPFVRDAEALKGQLATIHAEGGGDEPESLLDALYKVAEMGQMEKGSQTMDAEKWRPRGRATRIVIVFTDASYHEIMSIPEAPGGSFEDLKNSVHSKRIVLSIFAPDLPMYEKLSSLDRAEYLPINPGGGDPVKAMKDFTADTQNFAEVLQQLAQSVSASADVNAEPVEAL